MVYSMLNMIDIMLIFTLYKLIKLAVFYNLRFKASYCKV